MPAVKHRNWKEIDQPQINREDRNQRQKRDQAELSNLTRHLRDPQRTAQFLRTAVTRDHLAHGFEGIRGHVEGLKRRPPDSREGVVALILRPAPADPKTPDLLLAPRRHH